VELGDGTTVAVEERDFFNPHPQEDRPMELEKAKEIVKILANGMDPSTGEVLPPASPYNNPIVIRGLFTVLEALRAVRRSKRTTKERQQENIDAGRPKNAGLPWTDEMKVEVASRFQGGTSMDELSRHFERTRGSIVAELMRQGLVESRDEGGGR
jgi:hypothetical protein